MESHTSHRKLAGVGVGIYALAVIADILRIGSGSSLASTLELFSLQPLLPIGLVVAVVAVGLFVGGAWSQAFVTATTILGMVMVAVSAVGLVDLWNFSNGAAIPLGTIVWVFPTASLLGGLLVLAGALRELNLERVHRIREAVR